MYRVAWKMLSGDGAKYAGVVFGIGFSAFLITMLMSMFSGMMKRTHALVDDVWEADVWVMDPAVEYVDEVAGLPETALGRVRGVQGVKWAVPMYVGNLRVRLESGRFRSVQVIGVDDYSLVGGPPEMVSGKVEDLRAVDGVVVDETGSRNFLRMPAEKGGGMAGPTRELVPGDDVQINDKRARVVGVARVSTRFLAKATMYTTYSRARQFAPPERNLLSYVLVKGEAGEAARDLARKIEAQTGFRARTQREFQNDTVLYYVRNTPIVFQVGMMVTLGFVVGCAISAQLLYLHTVDNVRHYAVLKAMGLSNFRIVKMVVMQSVVCAMMGLGLGLGGANVLGMFVGKVGIPFYFRWEVPVAVACAVSVMGVLASVASCVRVLRLEVGIVFKA